MLITRSKVKISNSPFNEKGMIVFERGKYLYKMTFYGFDVYDPNYYDYLRKVILINTLHYKGKTIY